jgi:hypothetical protein
MVAVLTIGLTGLTAITKTLSAGDLAKLTAAYTPDLQAQGIASPTNQQLFEYWFDRMFAATITEVRARRRAAADAADPPIAFT